MYKSIVAVIALSGLLVGCATSPEQIACRQPNWRVSIEMGGMKPGLPPKPKPEAKPEAKSEAKPEAAPKPKPVPSQLTLLVQGNTAFDFKSAVLKDGGKAEIDKLVKEIHEGKGRDKRPFTVSSVVISGYSDSLESDENDNQLSEERAKAVRGYLVSKGIDQKFMFWEGKGSKFPIPVTKFCDS